MPRTSAVARRPLLPARTRVTVAGLTNPLARVALDVIAVKSN
jgi:enamine deaminase RidA (YjgF/YER057c/UK114 family)